MPDIIKKKSSVLLTEGTIWKQMLTFALPLFLGNLFQQLYNTADSLIVGNLLGDDALAAVSSSGSLIFLLVGFFNGTAMGAGVVTARFFGAKNEEAVERSVHTTVAFGLVAGLLMTVIGVFLTPTILQWMGTPENVLPSSISYFRTYFLGSFGFVMYNVFVGIMQSTGDSRHPLMYLALASVINVVLDLLFIAVFHWEDVAAAAMATVISQLISATLCYIRLIRSKECFRIRMKSIRFDSYMLKELLRNGLPAGLQNSIISIANVVVQSNINAFGSMAMAGSGAYSRIEGFAFLPINCFSQALTTFISQNIGAKKYDRVRKGARFGILCSTVLAELIGVLVWIGAPVLVAAFNNTPEVVAFGTMHARTDALFFCLLAYSHCLASIFRGAGKATVPMFVMLACWCIIRVTYITVAVSMFHDIQVVYWAYPITWSLSTIVFTIYYFKSDWIHYMEKRAAVSRAMSGK